MQRTPLVTFVSHTHGSATLPPNVLHVRVVRTGTHDWLGLDSYKCGARVFVRRLWSWSPPFVEESCPFPRDLSLRLCQSSGISGGSLGVRTRSPRIAVRAPGRGRRPSQAWLTGGEYHSSHFISVFGTVLAFHHRFQKQTKLHFVFIYQRILLRFLLESH